MADLKRFRKENNLTQDELGAYISVQKSFISRVEHGRELLPAEKFRMLMNNDRGWNTEALSLSDPSPKYSYKRSNVDSVCLAEESASSKGSTAVNTAVLEERISSLERELASSEARCAQYWELIMKLSSNAGQRVFNTQIGEENTCK